MVKQKSSKALAIILSAPSGAGKTSIAAALLSRDNNLVLSVSATTRKPRPLEVDGIHYFFKTTQEFTDMLARDAFLEHANIYGNMYGTPAHFVQNKMAQGYDVLFDIDYQGAYQIIKKIPDDVLSIFILPPSLDILKQRIMARSQDDAATIELRMQLAEQEIAEAKNYEYTVVNDNFDVAVNEIIDLINQRRLIRI